MRVGRRRTHVIHCWRSTVDTGARSINASVTSSHTCTFTRMVVAPATTSVVVLSQGLAARWVSQPGTAREIPTVIGNRVSFSTLPTRCKADVNNAAAAAAAVSLICRLQSDHRRIESAVCQQSERSSLQPSVCPPLSSHCQSARLALPLPDKLNDASGDMSSSSRLNPFADRGKKLGVYTVNSQ